VFIISNKYQAKKQLKEEMSKKLSSLSWSRAFYRDMDENPSVV